MVHVHESTAASLWPCIPGRDSSKVCGQTNQNTICAHFVRVYWDKAAHIFVSGIAIFKDISFMLD